MKEPTFLGRPFGLLGIMVLIAVGIFVVGENLRHGGKDTRHEILPKPAGVIDRMASEGQAFHPPTFAVSLDEEAQSDVNVRDLEEYYARRHYPGAPPRIPHAVDRDTANKQSCNACHEKGGYAPVYHAYTPVTPHPTFANCLQCHVSPQSEELFTPTQFVAVEPPPLHRAVLPGGPPPIPHSLQLRENCLACHAGPSAPLEIKTTHPERLNCRQCHVPSNGQLAFVRGVSGTVAP